MLNLSLANCSKTLKYGDRPISDARFRYPFESLTPKKKLLYFSAVSFTETPLGEIHNLLEISKRRIDLKPYSQRNHPIMARKPALFVRDATGLVREIGFGAYLITNFNGVTTGCRLWQLRGNASALPPDQLTAYK